MLSAEDKTDLDNGRHNPEKILV